MRILFFRHGESVDDTEDRFGGWADFPLNDNGRSIITSRVSVVKALNEPFEKIFTSPFLRAAQSAAILSEELSLPLEELVFLKERNKYGVLSGMNKDDAQKQYPDLVTKAEAAQYLYGAEHYEDFVERVKKALEILENQPHKCIIAVTHGNFMKVLHKEWVGKEIEKVDDGGFMLADVKDNTVRVLKYDGIVFS